MFKCFFILLHAHGLLYIYSMSLNTMHCEKADELSVVRFETGQAAMIRCAAMMAVLSPRFDYPDLNRMLPWSMVQAADGSYQTGERVGTREMHAKEVSFVCLPVKEKRHHSGTCCCTCRRPTMI